jgi:putative transposase
MMESWLSMIRAQVNFNLADRIDSYNQGFIQDNFCDLKTKGEACPLTCSVNKSASVGYPWKSEDPSKRRSKQTISSPKIKLGLLLCLELGNVLDKGEWQESQKKKKKEQLFVLPFGYISTLYLLDLCWKDKGARFNPRRSAYEMQSSGLPELKKTRSWYKAVNADVLQQALLNLDTAFQNFFEKRTQFPRFKSRSTFKSFEYKPGTVRIEGNRIRLPTLGWMKFYRSRLIPKGWEIRTCTITQEADGWYISILLQDKTVPDVSLKKPEELKSVTGVDRGIKKIVALASGEVVPNPLIYKRYERRLGIRQRRISRKKKGSKNRADAGKRIARLHQKIRRVRDDFQWKIASYIASSADVIGFENLNVKAMKSRCKPRWDDEQKRYLKNGQAAKSQLNKAISDAAWGNLLALTKHQAAKLGNWVVEVPARHSSQECSECHYVSPKNRQGEKFVCENCGHHDDADVDAGVVIAQRALLCCWITQPTAGQAESYARP